MKINFDNLRVQISNSYNRIAEMFDSSSDYSYFDAVVDREELSNLLYDLRQNLILLNGCFDPEIEDDSNDLSDDIELILYDPCEIFNEDYKAKQAEIEEQERLEKIELHKAELNSKLIPGQKIRIGKEYQKLYSQWFYEDEVVEIFIDESIDDIFTPIDKRSIYSKKKVLSATINYFFGDDFERFKDCAIIVEL